MIGLKAVLQGWQTRWPHGLSPILCDKCNSNFINTKKAFKKLYIFIL